jgi:hypothetical protein
MAKKSDLTTKKFLKLYDGAPFELHEFAEEAAHVVDNPSLSKWAHEYLMSKAMFEQELEKIGLEMG